MSLLKISHDSLHSSESEPCLEDLKNEKANMAIILDTYKDRFTALPKEKGLVTEYLYLYQGHWFPSEGLFSIANVMRSQDVFQANPSDIYLATLPKSGTWIKAIYIRYSEPNKVQKQFSFNSYATHLQPSWLCALYWEWNIKNQTHLRGWKPSSYFCYAYSLHIVTSIRYWSWLSYSLHV